MPTLIIFAFAAVTASGTTRPATDCDALAQAEATSMWDYVDKTTYRSCETDADCAVGSITAAICSSVYNVNAIAADSAYRDGVVYQTLEDKFQAIGCHHLYPPCPYPGNAACKAGQCVGVFP